METTKPTIDQKEDAQQQLLPEDGHPKLGLRIFEMLAEILEDRNNLGLPGKWNRNYELMKNAHWKKGSKKASLVTANLVYAHRQRTVNLLTDNNPTFNVTRLGVIETEDGEDVYNTLLHTCEYWWQETEQQEDFEKTVIRGETNGCTIEKMRFDADAEFGIGEVETELVDPFHFGVYPVKAKSVQKAEANLHFYPMSLREARRRWPEVADSIRGDEEILKELGDERREVVAGQRKDSRSSSLFGSIAGVVKNLLNPATGATGGDESAEVLIVEAWCRDYTLLETEDEKTVPKYKGFIRCVQTCNAGNVILSDRSNPSINPDLPDEQARRTYLYDKYPFILVPSVTDPESLWGISDIEQLEELQMEVDKALSQFTLWKDKAARLKLINPKNSGVSNSELTNYPGIIRPDNQMVAEGIRYLNTPVPPSDLTTALSLYKDLFFLVAGTFELEQAQTPGKEVIAYKAIAALIERASTMLRGKIRNYSRLIRERGRMYLSLAQNWYTQPRWISYRDSNDEVPKEIMGSELLIPARLGVVSGSTMPRSQIQEREEAIALYKDNAIDNEELLKKLDWTNWKEVIARMQAGSFGELFEKMAGVGVPGPIIEYFQEMANMEMKDFERDLQKGETTPFPAILQALSEGEGEPQPPPESPIDTAEVELKRAQVQKVAAEEQLLVEKATTERVTQHVAIKGVEFDEEKLKIERANIVSDIQEKRDRVKTERANTVAKLTKSAKKKGQGPYREKGMKSNNKQED